MKDILENSHNFDVDGPRSSAMGFVHSVETAGTVDGPGVRYVVFLTGCPLSCQYCHNPDALKLKNGVLRRVEDILNDIHDYRQFIERARGGVTISGGEPLVQANFTKGLLKGCKDMGLHTALDTSGYLGEAADDELLSYTDLVLLDIKSGIPDIYREVTGVEIDKTLEFAYRLSDMGKKVWVRFVLVPGLTDSEENIDAVAKIIEQLENVERVDILPFHQMGEFKWEQLDLIYKLKDTPPAGEKDVERAREIFARHSIQAV
jgi:pyruvate formate lyase activating enzyme